MFFRAISELSAISRMPKIPRDERSNARELIEELCMAGFTPHEIEELTEARWKSNTIAKYCRGLEVKDASEKNRALGLMKEFILKEGSWEELDYYVKTKRKLKSEGFEINDLLETKKEIDHYDIELELIGAISTRLRETDTKWSDFENSLKLLMDLVKLGYSVPIFKELEEKTRKLGGIEPTLKSVSFVLSEAKVQEQIQKFKKTMDDQIEEFKVWENKLEDVKHQVKINQFYVDYAEKLLNEYKLDSIALQTILTTANNYGEPSIILQALNIHGNLLGLEQNIKTKIEALKSLEDDITNLKAQKTNHESQVEELLIKIGEIKEKYKQSRNLQNLANLLYEPLRAELSPDEFKLLSLSILIGIRDYASSNEAALPKWKSHVENSIENAVTRLNNIVTGKL